MENRASAGKAMLNETVMALKSVRTKNIRIDLRNQLQQAENALKKRNKAGATAYMQALATTVLIFRRSLSSTVVANILGGIIIDSDKNGIALPRVRYNKNSQCVFNRGCFHKRGFWCATIDGTSGCGGRRGNPPRQAF